MTGMLTRVLRVAPVRRLATAVGLTAALAGCLAPDRDESAGDRFPVPPSRRERNPEWERAVARPFDTFGYDEPITNISLGALGQGLSDFGTPQPPAEPLDEN